MRRSVSPATCRSWFRTLLATSRFAWRFCPSICTSTGAGSPKFRIWVVTTQILNFGLPAPVDVQIEGQNLQANREVANSVLNQLRHVAGLTDLRIQQEFDYPRFNVDVDRTKAA